MAKYLLDTHTLLWWTENSDRLGDLARKLIADDTNQIFVSSVSVWEMVIKYALKKLRLPLTPRQFIERVMAEYKFTALGISFVHATHVGELPAVHADPFDRLLIAQSREENLPLITDDPQINKYQVETVW